MLAVSAVQDCGKLPSDHWAGLSKQEQLDLKQQLFTSKVLRSCSIKDPFKVPNEPLDPALQIKNAVAGRSTLGR